MKINKEIIKEHFNNLASVRERWIRKAKGFYEEDLIAMREFIPKNSKILEIGSGNGNLICSLEPSKGLGIDISEGMIRESISKNSKDIDFIQSDIENPNCIKNIKQIFDFIIISDTIGYLTDIENTFNNLHKVCNTDTRIIVAYYSPFWEPILNLAAKLKLKMPELQKIL